MGKETTTQLKTDKIFQESSKTMPFKWENPMIRLFQKRNIDKENLDNFLSWDLNTIPDLGQMKDLEKAAQRIILAIQNGEKIGVYGDYDVDGTTSCAFLYHFFRYFNITISIFQPDRFDEGYGLHLSSIDKAKANSNTLLITVDCGITNNEAADYARERGIDLIITDHHQDARESMPNAYAVINPNRRDEDPSSPLCKLAGVGVAFALALKIKKEFEKNSKNGPLPSLYPLLPFVAIGSLCDLVPLNTLNLRLCRHGLKEIKQQKFPGIDVFFSAEDFRHPFLDSDSIGFKVGPFINSKGRLEKPQEALNLLMALDKRSARHHYLLLEESNKRRKAIQAGVYKEAKEKVLSEIEKESLDIIVTYGANWHEGVIGIVASKLVENFKVPAIVLTNAEDPHIIKGSARTAGQLNIFELLSNCQDLFKKFGGHKAAAGLSFPKENLKNLVQRLKENIKKYPASIRTVQPKFDIELSFDEVTPELLNNLKYLGPYGNGNEYPVFSMQDALISSYQVLSGTHVKFIFSSRKNPLKTLKGISFFYLDKWGMIHPEELKKRQETEQLQIFFQLKSEMWKGSEFLGLHVQEIKLSF